MGLGLLALIGLLSLARRDPWAAAGLALAFLLNLAIVVGWVLLATQPEGGWQHDRLAGWSSDIGITFPTSPLSLRRAARRSAVSTGSTARSAAPSATRRPAPAQRSCWWISRSRMSS